MNCELSYIKHKLYNSHHFKIKNDFFSAMFRSYAPHWLFSCMWVSLSLSLCVLPCRIWYFFSFLVLLFLSFIFVHFNSIVSPFYGLRRAMAVTAWNIIYSLWLYNLNFFLGWQEQYFCLETRTHTHRYISDHLEGPLNGCCTRQNKYTYREKNAE